MARGRQARRRRSALRTQKRAELTRKQALAARNPEVSGQILASLKQRAEARANAGVSETFEVTGSTSLALSDRATAWDADAAAKTLDASDYPKAFFWHDQAKPEDEITSYKLGFASKDGDTLTAIFRGITAVAGVLQGARGGVKGISDADIAGIKTKVETWYSKAAKEYDDPNLKAPWDADETKGENAAILLAYAESSVKMVRLEDGAFASVTADDPTALEAYNERVAYWEQAEEELAETAADSDSQAAEGEVELVVTGEEASVVESTEFDAALLRMQEQLAAMPACANCDHAYTDHLGVSGPCTVEGCDCTSYESADDAEPDDDPDDEAEAAAEEFAPEVVQALRLIGESGEAARAYALAQLAAPDTEVALPDEHQPGARRPRTRPSRSVQDAPAPQAEDSAVHAWNSIFAPEGKLTSDRRAFAPGAITWRELPLTLMAMTETSEGGHVGAEIAGRIDDVWRDESAQVAEQYGATALIRGKGIFDVGEYGQEIARLVDDKTLRGVSVDLAISKYVTGPRSKFFDEDGNWAPQEDADAPSLIDLYDDDTIAVVLEAEIGMVTACPFPAFAEAKIATGESLVAGAHPDAFWTAKMDAAWSVSRCEPCSEALVASVPGGTPEGSGSDTADEGPSGNEGVGPTGEVLTASAAGLAPEKPPSEWFADPQLEGATPITVDDDGRIYGHAALWGVCHIGFPGSCRTAPHSESDYTYFHLGEVLCEDGERLACGQITLDTGHADLKLDRAGATAHYDHTGTVIAHVCCGEDEYGIWVAGALQPDAPAEKVRLMRGSKLSGDWRGKELVALLCVNVPGFPVPRAQAALAASGRGEEPEVMAMVAAGIPVFETEIPAEDRERFRALQAHAEFAALADEAA